MGHPLPAEKTVRKDRWAGHAILEVPTLLVIAIAGFVIEFLYELPLMVICMLHAVGGAKAKKR